MWQDSSNIVKKNWQGAKSYCNNLSLGGYDDWRVPNLNELYTIADRSIDLPALNNTFQNTRSEIYWSSTTVAISDTTAWIIDFYKAYDGWHNNDETAFIRCVRN